MRLICGLLHLDGATAEEDVLRAMAAQMNVPRLRPALRLWRRGPVGLALLDFSARAAPAPALPEQDGAALAADIRLDEPAALGQTLGRAAGASEDALLFDLLQKHGPSALDRVLGDFSFGWWNEKAERLVCGRDALGIRPLFYAHRPGRLFAFASLPKALYSSGIVAKSVDEDAVARRMLWQWRHDDSLIAGIARLPPAHTIEVSREGVTLSRYFQFDRAMLGTRRCTPEEAARDLRRLVDEAVRRRLPRDGAIGAHLSGGLDSSAIAVLAARQLREEGRVLHAYAFLDRPRNDVTAEDESSFVESVLEQEGDIDCTRLYSRVGLPMLDEPFEADKMTETGPDEPENAACIAAERQGVHLLLSGWGGDEGATFNGRGALAELFLRGRWRTLAREIAALKRERGWPAFAIFRGEVLAHLRPKRLAAKSGEPDLTSLSAGLLSDAARGQIAPDNDERSRVRPDGRENRWRLITSPHIAHRAEVWALRGARHGLAFAFPLLDRRVLEFALSLPSEFFLRGGYRRRTFRDAMADVLPERVRRRHIKYQPFPRRMLDIAERKDELLARVEACEQHAAVRRVIDLARLRKLVEALPSPDDIRAQMRKGENPTVPAAIVAAINAITTATYLTQHAASQPLADHPNKPSERPNA